MTYFHKSLVTTKKHKKNRKNKLFCGASGCVNALLLFQMFVKVVETLSL